MRKKHLRSILALVSLVGMIGVFGCTHRSQHCARWESHSTEISPLIEQQTMKHGWASGTHNLEQKQPDTGPVLNAKPAASGDQSADEAENLNVGTPVRTKFRFENETPDEGLIDNAPSTNLDFKSSKNPPDAVATLEKLGALIEFDEDGNVQRADLSQTQITEAELWSLAGLTEIKELNHSDTQLTDVGLEHLAVGEFRPGIRQDLSTIPASEAQRRLISLLGSKLGDPHFLEAVGQFFASQRRWNEAVEILELAVLVSPDETILRYHLAAALAHSGNAEAAMPHFQQSVGDAAAHYNIGVILYQNALQASREKFLEALEKNPDLKEAELWLDEVSGTRIP